MDNENNDTRHFDKSMYSPKITFDHDSARRNFDTSEEYNKVSCCKCCRQRCCLKSKKGVEPKQANVFKSEEVAKIKYPKVYKVLSYKFWDALLVFACLASIFLFIFCEGFLVQSRVTWGLMHAVNALFIVLLLLQWVNIILKTKYGAQISFTKFDIIFALLSVLPIDLIILLIYSINPENGGNTRDDHITFTASRLHYIFRIRYILKYLSNWENQLILGDFHSFLLRVLLYTCFLLHSFACVWHRIACNSFRPKHFLMEGADARAELCANNSWVMRLSNRALASTKNSTMFTPFLQSKPESILWDHYLASLYWSTGMAFRLGYGDLEINMVSTAEVVFTALCQLISWIFVLTVVSGTLTSLLIESDTERESYLTRRFAIKHYLSFSRVGKSVIHEVKKFYDYLWSKRKGVSELMLMDFMPAAMKSEIFFDIHKFVLEQMPLFQDLDLSFLMLLSVRMTHSFHLQGETLFPRNDRGKHMFYVLKGHLEIMSADESHPIACIRSGSCIGDIFLVHPYAHCCTVRCGSECDILALTRNRVKEVLQDYPHYFDVLQTRIQERFEQCLLILRLALNYGEAPQVFAKMHFEMPMPDLVTDHPTSNPSIVNIDEDSAKKVNSEEVADIKSSVVEIPDSDGPSIHPSVMDKIPTLQETTKKDKKGPRRKSVQEEAYTAFAADVNRTSLLAKDLGIGRAPLFVSTPVTIIAKDSKDNIISGDSESLFTKLVNMPIMKGDERSSLLLCWKLFVSFCVCSILFYYPYQFAFRSTTASLNLKVDGIMHLTDIIFAIDFSFDMLQIVVTPQKTLETVSKILAYRVRSPIFYIRLFAFLPIEYPIAMSITSNFATSPYLYLCKVNRFLEAIVLTQFFQDLDGVTKIPVMTVFLTKFLLVVLYVIHLFAILYEFILRDCIYPRHLSNWPYKTYGFVVYWSTQIVTSAGFGDIVYLYLSEVGLLCLALITGTIVVTYLSAKVAAILANAQRRRISFTQTYYGVTTFLKQRQFPEDLSRRIKSYYKMQWKAHEGVLIPQERSAIWDAPEAVVSEVCLAQSLWLISRVPLLRHTTEAVLVKIAKALKQYFVPPGECVLFEGDKRRELYIIVKGFCNVHRGKELVGHLTKGNYFGLSGLILGVNQNYRITTETHCLFFCLQYNDFLEIAKKHKFLRRDYKILREEKILKKYDNKTTGESHEDQHSVETLKGKGDESHNLLATVRDQVVSEYSVEFQVKKKKDYDPYQFFRYFLLRRTILPSGIFMICWMTFRVSCGVMISYYVLAQVAFAFNPRNTFIVILFYDIIAWFDLYIMLHVAYYNHLNQLVTDPVKTAVNYLKGPFIIDLLFCFPFDLVTLATFGDRIRLFNTVKDYHGHYRLISFIRLNRVFQAYKLVQMGQRLNNTIFHSLSFITLLEVVPWMILFIHILACLSVFFVCDVSPNGDLFTCTSQAWLTHGSIYKNLPVIPELQKPWKMYLIAVYWTISTALRVGFGDIELLNEANRIISVCVVIAGTLVATYISSKLTACMVGEDSRRIEIRTKIDIMQSFLDRFKASRSVQKRVKEIYLNEWDKTKGISVDQLFVALHPSLKSEVLSHLYEESIRQSPLLKNVDEPGIRMLSSILKEVFLVEGEYIFQYGNIGDDVFLLASGIVTAYNTRGEVMSYLGAGSLIGEMAALYGITRLYNAIATTDTDILVFSASDFLDFLELYPDLKEKLEELCLRHYQEALAQDFLTNAPAPLFHSLDHDSQISPAKDHRNSKEFLPKSSNPVPDIRSDRDGAKLRAEQATARELCVLDPLRVPLRRGKVKEEEKELLLSDTSNSNNKWWSIFITFGHVPKTEMGAVCHIFQEKKRCNLLNFTIHPASTVVRSSGWSVFNLLITAISCSLTSYEISFTSLDEGEVSTISILRYCAEAFFVIRIIGNFHLGYLDDSGTLITDVKVISIRYLKKFDGFILDIATTIPFYTIAYMVGGPHKAVYAANIRGIQLLRVILFVRYLGETGSDLRMKASEVKILKITILLCFIFHFCACAWYLVACYGMVCEGGTWMDILLSKLQSAQQIQNKTDISIASRYWISVAYVTTTITATGLNNVTPRSAIELLATICFIFGTVFIIGLLLGEMTQCLASQISRKIHYEHELSVVETHFTGLGLKKSKKEKVTEYYKLVWRRFQGMPYYSLLNEFPGPLRSDIAFEIYGPNLKNSKILGKVDEQILRQITARVRHEFYLPGGHIVRSGNVCDAVYFIKRGEVVIIDQKKGIELCVETLHENDCFGEIKILLPREAFRFSYVARLETEVGVLHRDDLDAVLKSFPVLRNDIVEKAKRIKSHRTAVKELQNELKHTFENEKFKETNMMEDEDQEMKKSSIAKIETVQQQQQQETLPSSSNERDSNNDQPTTVEERMSSLPKNDGATAPTTTKEGMKNKNLPKSSNNARKMTAPAKKPVGQLQQRQGQAKNNNKRRDSGAQDKKKR